MYKALFDRVFTKMDPEVIHERAFSLIRAGRPLTEAVIKPVSDPRKVMGIVFPNALGLAAGFDKNAVGVMGLLALGFGHIEIGTVTAQAQPGNPKPRLFRLVADEAIINRMGFNNDGAEVVAGRLAKIRNTQAGANAIIGVNIGKTKIVPPENAIADYVASTELLSPYASYLVVNVSSPNTPGLRDLQAVESLRPLLAEVKNTLAADIPVVVKIAPDLADVDVDAIVDLCGELELHGIIATNTTIERPAELKTPRIEVEQIGAGGLSGPILAKRSAAVLERIANRANGQLAIISVGGINTPDELRKRLDLGADLVQAYAGFVYGGPRWPRMMAAAAK